MWGYRWNGTTRSQCRSRAVRWPYSKLKVEATHVTKNCWSFHLSSTSRLPDLLTTSLDQSKDQHTVSIMQPPQKMKNNIRWVRLKPLGYGPVNHTNATTRNTAASITNIRRWWRAVYKRSSEFPSIAAQRTQESDAVKHHIVYSHPRPSRLLDLVKGDEPCHLSCPSP